MKLFESKGVKRQVLVSSKITVTKEKERKKIKPGEGKEEKRKKQWFYS